MWASRAPIHQIYKTHLILEFNCFSHQFRINPDCILKSFIVFFLFFGDIDFYKWKVFAIKVVYLLLRNKFAFLFWFVSFNGLGLNWKTKREAIVNGRRQPKKQVQEGLCLLWEQPWPQKSLQRCCSWIGQWTGLFISFFCYSLSLLQVSVVSSFGIFSQKHLRFDDIVFIYRSCELGVLCAELGMFLWYWNCTFGFRISPQKWAPMIFGSYCGVVKW